MPEKVGFWKRIEGSKKLQVLFFCMSMFILLAGYLCLEKKVYIAMVSKYPIVEDDFSWVYQIDSIKEENNQLVIDGWAYKLNQQAQEGAYEIYLHNLQNGERHLAKMSYSVREDVNNYFLCEYDYSMSGFRGVIETKELDTKNDEYEILLYQKKSQAMFATNIYYIDGRLEYVNTDEYKPIITNNSDLKKIIEDGKLRVYQPEFEIYVYQYKNRLYWIVDKDYSFKTEDEFIQLQLQTTQKKNLPPHRVEQNLDFDNLGFSFNSFEITNWSVDDYRITSIELPTDYSIIKIWTGEYTDDWEWLTFFRPYHFFGINSK